MRTRSAAFAAQAAGDLAAYKHLAASTLPSNHALHYLQMWLEKLCKARLWQDAVVSTDLLYSHNLVAKVLPRLISDNWRQLGFEQRPPLDDLRELCREIDRLHPQVNDNERRPDNVEYPWLSAVGHHEVPSSWKFPLQRRLYTPTGKLLLKAAVLLTQEANQPAE